MRGHTLIELALVLALGAVIAASLAPAGRRYVDRAAVVRAREATVALLAEARVAAMAAGDARVTVAAGPWSARSEAGGAVLHRVPLEEDFGVAVDLSGGRSETTIAFNGLGLGKVASETLTFRRGSATATLIVSSYGRVRRQ